MIFHTARSVSYLFAALVGIFLLSSVYHLPISSNAHMHAAIRGVWPSCD